MKIEPSLYQKAWNPEGSQYVIRAEILDKNDGQPPVKTLTIDCPPTMVVRTALVTEVKTPLTDAAARDLAKALVAAADWNIGGANG